MQNTVQPHDTMRQFVRYSIGRIVKDFKGLTEKLVSIYLEHRRPTSDDEFDGVFLGSTNSAMLRATAMYLSNFLVDAVRRFNICDTAFAKKFAEWNYRAELSVEYISNKKVVITLSVRDKRQNDDRLLLFHKFTLGSEQPIDPTYYNTAYMWSIARQFYDETVRLIEQYNLQSQYVD